MTISDHHLRHKSGRTNTSCTHMLFKLTYFHMYWRLSVLQDIYMKYMRSMIKVHNPESVKQTLQNTNKKKAHLPRQTGRQSTEEGT
jgi:DNA-directed RNA polymerase specialized sigma subunit